MKVVILAGGLGTRLSEETDLRPKPMVEVGGRPIIWHIAKHYAHYGFEEFFMALGYKSEIIKRYFVDYQTLSGSMTIDLSTGNAKVYDRDCEGWIVHLMETGIETNTGGRLKRLEPWLKDGTFMLTYGDGLCDINLSELLAFHRANGRIATVTAVRPPSRFGGLVFEGDLIKEFIEKPQIGEGWINGGFMVFEPEVFRYLKEDGDSLETEALEQLAREGQLAAYRHNSFWQCMDTLRDKRFLENLWHEQKSAVENLGINQAPTGTGFWLDRPVLVTGGSGLVGGWLVRRLLESKAEVVCLVRDWVPQSELVRAGLLDKVKTVRGDVCDQELLERTLGEYEIDTVIHLAAQTIVTIANRNPVSTFETNIKGTWSLLEACRRSPLVKQIVMASSDKAYGDHEVLPYNEDTPLQGVHPYDVSKSCSDLISQTYAKTYGLPVAITRCGNFYGGGDLNWNRIVPGTIRSVLRGQRPVIRSDGNYVRDYFYVEDGAAAYTTLAECLAADRQLAGQAFNFSNEIQVTVTEIVQKILGLMGSNLTPEVRNETTNEIRHQYLSAAKAREALQWRPLFTLDDGLQRTIDWYKTFLAES